MGKRGKAWLLALVGLGMLTAGAWFFDRPGLEQHLSKQVHQHLKGAGVQAAQVEVVGRDVVIRGEVSSLELRRQVLGKVHAIYGVRRVDAQGLKVAEASAPKPAPVRREMPKEQEPKAVPAPVATPAPVVRTAPEATPAPEPPPAPTVNRLLSNEETPRITGVIVSPEKVLRLKVELAGHTYEEGDGHLKREGELWVLVPAEPLSEGVHDVKVIAIGKGDATSTDKSTGEIVIDRTPPAAPVVEELRLAGMQAIMLGAWPAEDARLLRIVVGNDQYDIDETGSPLVSDGDGRFRLMLPAARLPEMRKAKLLVIDEAKNITETRPPAEVLGNACQQQLDEVLIQDMIHFETGKADISKDSLLLLDRLAQVLRGCADMEVVIVGHTDNVGDLVSNQQLSEARANAVKQALVERGLNPDVIIARGEGETQPLVANDSERKRQINRRIEISVRPRQQ